MVRWHPDQSAGFSLFNKNLLILLYCCIILNVQSRHSEIAYLKKKNRSISVISKSCERNLENNGYKKNLPVWFHLHKKMRQWWSGVSCPFERSTWSLLAFSLFTSSPSLFSVAMRHSSWSQGFHNSLLEEQKPKRWTKQGRPTQTSSHLTHTSHLWVLRWHTNSQFKTSSFDGWTKCSYYTIQNQQVEYLAHFVQNL